MKRILNAFLMGSVATAAVADIKIGFVKIDDIMTFDDQKLRKAPDEWQAMVRAVSDDLKSRASAIESKAKDLKERAAKLQDDTKWQNRSARETEAERLRELEHTIKLQAESLQEFQQRKVQELQMTYGMKIQKTAEDFAKAKGYDLILYGPALYVGPSVDVTNDSIDALNKAYRAEQAAKKFKKDDKA